MRDEGNGVVGSRLVCNSWVYVHIDCDVVGIVLLVERYALIAFIEFDSTVSSILQHLPNGRISSGIQLILLAADPTLVPEVCLQYCF